MHIFVKKRSHFWMYMLKSSGCNFISSWFLKFLLKSHQKSQNPRVEDVLRKFWNFRGISTWPTFFLFVWLFFLILVAKCFFFFSFSHQMGNERFCCLKLFETHKITQTCHQVKSTITTDDLWLLEKATILNKKKKKKNSLLLPSTHLNSSYVFQSIAS